MWGFRRRPAAKSRKLLILLFNHWCRIEQIRIFPPDRLQPGREGRLQSIAPGSSSPRATRFGQPPGPPGPAPADRVSFGADVEVNPRVWRRCGPCGSDSLLQAAVSEIAEKRIRTLPRAPTPPLPGQNPLNDQGSSEKPHRLARADSKFLVEKA